jgi:hypothetical protein
VGGGGSNTDGTSGNTIDSIITAFTAAENKAVSSTSLEDKLMTRIASFRKRSSINTGSDLLKNLRHRASNNHRMAHIRASGSGWLATPQERIILSVSLDS